MFCFFLRSTLSESDRRLDPFQFNVCAWDMKDFDEKEHNNNEVDNVAQIFYSHLSTCDTILVPGFKNETTTARILNIMESKGMKGFVPYKADAKASFTLYSRLDLEDKQAMPAKVTYPIADKKCKDSNEGEYDFSDSFYGTYTFHDTVNKTTFFAVDFPEDAGMCSLREALATEICNQVKELPADHDVIISGSFGVPSDKDEVYEQVLTGCGFKKASVGQKGLVSNNKGTVIEDVYIKGGASKWIDIFTPVELKEKVYTSDVKEIEYPSILYIHQPLSKRWFKFEVTFSVVMLTVAISFFVWLLYFSRVRKEDDGEYEKISEK